MAADQDPAKTLAQEADKLDARLDRLGDHIEEARHKADAADGTAGDHKPGEEIVGDFHDTEGGPMFGQDPEGAAEEHGHHHRPT